MRCLTFSVATLPTVSSVGTKVERGRSVWRMLQLPRQEMVVVQTRVTAGPVVRRGRSWTDDADMEPTRSVAGFIVEYERNTGSQG